MIFDSLPDDILDNIYSKIIFPQDLSLLKQILNFPLTKEWVYYLHFVQNEVLEELLIDIAVIYAHQCENININYIYDFENNEYIIDTEKLSEKSIIYLNDYYYIIDYINESNNLSIIEQKNEILKLINKFIKMDITNINSLIEPIINPIQLREIEYYGYKSYTLYN